MSAARECAQMCRTELVPAFVKLLRDSEAEVRVAAAGKVAAFCKILPPEQVRHGFAALVPRLPVFHLYVACTPLPAFTNS